MRTTFIKTLTTLAEEDEKIWLLCGDLGYSVLEEFRDKFPSRFLNVGIAEQNMAGIAAGLAMTGNTVFIYSIANFPIMRCLEQIRNDICYHNLNVKIVAVGGGLAYGSAGYSHHAVEDLAVMTALPHMTVIAPGDPIETKLATQALTQITGPGYLRLGKAGEPIIHQTLPHFQIGKAIKIKEGKDITLITTGGVLDIAVKATEQLEIHGVSAEVLSMHTLSPLDTEAILQTAIKTKKVITIEEHGRGGLASAVAEVLAQSEHHTRFVPLRLNYETMKIAASQNVLRASAGLSVENIVKTAFLIL